MRKTDFTIEQLIAKLDAAEECSPDMIARGEHPRCLILNEIGATFVACNGTESETAKRKLVDLLESPNVLDQWFAWRYLDQGWDQLDADSRAHLEVFRSQPENASTIYAF